MDNLITFHGLVFLIVASLFMAACSNDGNPPVEVIDITEEGIDAMPYAVARDEDPSDIEKLMKAIAINEDGSKEAIIYDLPESCSECPIAWSPDGEKLVFADNNNVVIIDIATGIEEILYLQGLTNAYEADWSPDGSRIAFHAYDRNLDGWFDIYVINTDGSGLRRLTDSTGGDFDPSWSPDNTRLVFHSSRKGEGWEYPLYDLYIVDVETGQEIQLTDNDFYEEAATWSPVDDRILHVRVGGLYTIFPDGSGLALVSDGTDMIHWEPEWSPDATKVAFPGRITSGEFVDIEIFVINSDGSERKQLTTNDVDDRYVSWRYVPGQ